MKEVEGLLNSKRPKTPNPKPSPKDFVWPSQVDHDDVVAKKIAASLQELLAARGWKHTQLAHALWGVAKNGTVRNMGAARRYIVAEHPIPNEETAGFIAELLDVPMSRLLEPEGKFDPRPEMIRSRSPNGVNLAKMGGRKKKGSILKATPKETMKKKHKKKAKTAETSYYMRTKLAKLKRKHRAVTNGSGSPDSSGNAWVLQDGVPIPEYQFQSSEEHPGHLKITIEAVVPHPRAMAILHMLEHQAPPED